MDVEGSGGPQVEERNLDKNVPAKGRKIGGGIFSFSSPGGLKVPFFVLQPSSIDWPSCRSDWMPSRAAVPFRLTQVIGRCSVSPEKFL
jgi:hypothetical protein